MSAPAYILFLHGPTWQIARVEAAQQVTFADLMPPDADATPQLAAKHVATALRNHGYAGQPALLALAAGDCLAAAIDTDDLPRGDRKAMLYRFEEKVPLAAEHVVADFAAPVGGGRTLGACVREDAIAPLLNSLEAHGVSIQSLAPAALLAAQHVADPDAAQDLLIAEDDQLNVIAVRDGAPAAWSLVPATANELRLQLDLFAMEVGDGAPLRAAGVSPDVLAGRPAEQLTASPRTLAALAGAAVLAGRRRPWIEFRRDALAIADPLRLHRRGLNALLATAAVFCLCLTAAFLWRAHRYASESHRAAQAMSDEFVAAFPGWATPGNVRATVESERRKVAGRGTGGMPAELKESALRTAHDVLAKLPPDVKFQANNVMLNDTSFIFSLKLRSFEDVDRFAKAAREGGFDVPLPTAQRGPDGYWTVDLRGQRIGAARNAAASAVLEPTVAQP